jgi:N-acetylmuramic acid 6-phosphate etherase
MELLKKADGHVKVAIVMQRRRVNAQDARALLDRHEGKLRDAIES